MRKILDPKNLPNFGALVQAVLFSIAGDRHFPVFGWLVGLGVGAVVNWSMAIASSRVSDIAKNRKLLAYSSLFVLVCISPVVICSSLGWTVANFSWAVAADLSITLTGSIVGKSLIPQSESKTPQKSAPAKPANRKKSLSEISCRYAGAGCGRKFASQNSANAHARSCGFKPTIAMPIDVSDKGAKPTQKTTVEKAGTV